MSAVISKAAARAAGLKRYFTGEACVRGHTAERSLAGVCVECTKMYQQKWYASNKEQHAEATRAWYLAHRDVTLQRHREWRLTNKERASLLGKLWRDAHKQHRKSQAAAYYVRTREERLRVSRAWYGLNRERKAASGRAWKQRRADAHRIHAHNRRERERNADGSRLSPDLAARLWAEQAGRCACPCRRSLRRTGYHLDHIVALACGGENVDANIQLLTPRCNLMKGTKTDTLFMTEQAIRYVQEAAC